MGERKEEMREGGEETRVQGEGEGEEEEEEGEGEGEIEAARRKPAQDWWFSDITYYVSQCRYICMCMLRTMCMYVHTTHIYKAIQYCSGCTCFSSFFRLSFLFLRSSSPFSLSSSFLSPIVSSSLHPLARLLFAVETRVSLAHILEADRLQRVLKYRHAVYSMERVAYGGRDLKTWKRSVL